MAVISAQAETPQAVPVDGEPFAAELTTIDPQWEVAFGTGDERRVLPAAELVRWGSCAEARRGPLVVLADGGILVAEVLAVDKERLSADSDLFGLVELPLDLLAGVVFRFPADRHDRDLLLDRVASATGDSDQVILANGDEVSGRVQAVREQVIKLETTVGPVDVETHRTHALVFDPALRLRPERQGLRAMAGFSDGSRLVADRLVVGEEKLEIDVAAGITWRTGPERLVLLQPLGGRVTYLSDLKAAGYRHVPFLDLDWPYRTDRNVCGGMLRSGGRLYLKGLGMHSAARLTYLLEQPYRRFQAELAIDDATSGQGSVRFRVFVDGREEYASETIRGAPSEGVPCELPPNGRPRVPVSVDLDGAKRLDLVVDFADRADVQDHANWLDARLVE